jgi:hypothetical protein
MVTKIEEANYGQVSCIRMLPPLSQAKISLELTYTSPAGGEGAEGGDGDGQEDDGGGGVEEGDDAGGGGGTDEGVVVGGGGGGESGGDSSEIR